MVQVEERVIVLGTFPKGIIAEGISYQYLDENGAPVNMLTGSWSAQAKAEQLHVTSQPVSSPGGGVPTVVVGTATVSYAWDANDFVNIGRFHMVLYVGDGGTNRLPSPIFEWEVVDGPGADPTV